MKIVVQRVGQAEVRVGGKPIATIGAGMLLLVAVMRGDREADLDWCAEKIAGMRIFSDPAGKMNLSLEQAGGAVLAVSQFTLAGSLRRGRRPSFEAAAPPESARELYERFVELLRERGMEVRCGVFQAEMEVELVNDGPVTLLLDSADRLRSRNG